MDIIMIISVIGSIACAIYIFLIVLRERELSKGKNVDTNSVMATKYAYLIEQTTKSPNAKILVMTSDYVYIRSIEKPTATNIYITERANLLEIKWIAQMARMGTHEKKWTFDTNFPQEKMIEEIKKFLDQKSKEITGNIL